MATDLMNAVVIGGTGATGRSLVGSMLKAKDKVGKVTLISRRKLEGVDPEYGVDVKSEERAGRLVQHVEDLNDISDDTVKQLCTGHHVFFNCLSTSSQGKPADEFRRIDYDIPFRLIKLAHQVNVSHCSMVTSKRSNAKSFSLYLRTKGELEDSVKALEFNYISIFQPGLLERHEMARFGEKIASVLFPTLSVRKLGEVMMQDAWNYFSSAKKVVTFSVEDIQSFVKKDN